MADKKNDKNNNKSSKKDNKPTPKAATVKPSKPAPVKMGGTQPTSTIGKAPGAPVNTGGKNPKPNPDMPVEKKAKDVARHPSGQVKDFKAKTAQNNNKLAKAKQTIRTLDASARNNTGMAPPQGSAAYRKAQKIVAKARIQNKQALRQGYESPKEMVQARKADKAAAQQPTRPGATGGNGIQQGGKLIRTPPPRPSVVAGTPVTSGIRPTAPVAPAPAANPAPPKTGGPPPSTATAGKGTQAPAVVGNAGAPSSTVTGIQQGGQTAASIAANSAVAAGQRGRGSFRFR